MHARIAHYLHRIAALLCACGPLASCSSAPPPPPITIVVEQPPVDPLTPAERLLALLTADNPRLEQVAMSLVNLGDRSTLRAAGRRLVAIARKIGTPAWREAERAQLGTESALETDDEPRAPSAAQAQLEEHELRALKTVLAAMFHVGGPDVIDHCFALAEDDTAALDRRRLALRVLDRVLDPADAARIARRAQLAARLQSFGWADVHRASDAVSHMRRAFARCYQRALQQDPAFTARVQLKLHVGPRGRVLAVIDGDPLPPELNRCLREVAQRIPPLDQETPGAQITIPFMFSSGKR